MPSIKASAEWRESDMRPFVFERADSPAAAVLAAAGQAEGDEEAQFLAGGTTLIDLMKLDVMRPEMVIDINALERTALGRIDADASRLRLGALVRMADAADHPVVRRDYLGGGADRRRQECTAGPDGAAVPALPTLSGVRLRLRRLDPRRGARHGGRLARSRWCNFRGRPRFRCAPAACLDRRRRRAGVGRGMAWGD